MEYNQNTVVVECEDVSQAKVRDNCHSGKCQEQNTTDHTIVDVNVDNKGYDN